MKLLFFARIFSHTHIYTNTYTTVFHFSRFSREKGRKIISSSASKNLFRTIRSPSKFNHSSLYLGKPARSKRPRFPCRARKIELPLRRALLRSERSIRDFRSKAASRVPVTWPRYNRLHVRRGKQCCLSTSRSEPLDKVVESISKHSLTLRISDNPLLSGTFNCRIKRRQLAGFGPACTIYRSGEIWNVSSRKAIDHTCETLRLVLVLNSSNDRCREF